MTFFEYKTTLAKIETSNYQQLRKLHTKLSDFPMDNFYTIHAINKTITKFKALTKSAIIKHKQYPTGTGLLHFYTALGQATSKEEIVSLITDFAGETNLKLPIAKNAIKHIAIMLISAEDCKILDKTHLTSDYYSVGQCIENSRIALSEKNRLLPSIITYLNDIKDTAVYNYFLNSSISTIVSWQSTKTSRTTLLNNINAQIELYKEYTKSLAKTYTILEEEFQKDTQP